MESQSITHRRVEALKRQYIRDVTLRHGNPEVTFDEAALMLGELHEIGDAETQQIVMNIWVKVKAQKTQLDAFHQLAAGAQALALTLEDRLEEAEREIDALSDPIRCVASQIADHLLDVDPSHIEHYLWMLTTGNVPFELMDWIQDHITVTTIRSQEMVAS